MTYYIFDSNPWILPVGLFVVLTLAVELPYQVFRGWDKAPVSDEVWNVIQGAVLGLVAFVLGLSFSQAEARYDVRRTLVVTEANSIGTTWLRSDQLPPAESRRFRSVLTDYTALRLHAYREPTSLQIKHELGPNNDAYQQQLWSIASGALRRDPRNLGYSLLLQTLNETIDLSSEQFVVLTSHVPTTIVTMTLGLVLLGATLIGFGFARSKKNPRVLGLAYTLACAIVVNMMVDLDRPQTGFIRVDLTPLASQLAAMR